METNLEEFVEHHGLCYDGPVYSFTIKEGKHGPNPRTNPRTNRGMT